jgi:hypothetical protein
MFTYDVTATGQNRFQVRVTGPYPIGTHLIDDFGSLSAAEAFAGRMREFDAGETHITPIPFLATVSLSDRRIDDLIRQSRTARAAAEKACRDAIEIEVKARHLRKQAMMQLEYSFRLHNGLCDAPARSAAGHAGFLGALH